MIIHRTSRPWVLMPLFGTIAFVGLYILATFFYPGGSEFNHQAKGFSWLHNYWCNLLNEKSINGQTNSAQPIASAAFVVLGLTLVSFWCIYPRQMHFEKKARWLMQGAGLLCFFTMFFLTSALHDIVINIGGFFGLVAMSSVYFSLYQNKWYKLFSFGVFNLLMIGLNNYIYYTKEGFSFLPVVQKITFLTVLLWIVAIDMRLYIRSKFSNVRTR